MTFLRMGWMACALCMMAFVASLALSDTPAPQSGGIEIWRGRESSDPERQIVDARDTGRRQEPGIRSSGGRNVSTTLRQESEFPARRESPGEAGAGETDLTRQRSKNGIRKAAVYDFRQKPAGQSAVDGTRKSATNSTTAKAKRYPQTAVVYEFPRTRRTNSAEQRSPLPNLQAREHDLSVARQMLAEADDLANSGDFHGAVHLVRRAQSLPVDWSAEKFSPNMVLADLKRRYAETSVEGEPQNRRTSRETESSPRSQPEDSGLVVPRNNENRFGLWTGMEEDEAKLQPASHEAESFPARSRQDLANSVSPANRQLVEEQRPTEQEPQRLRIDGPVLPLQAGSTIPPLEVDRSAEIWYGDQPTTNSYRDEVAGADSQSKIETTTNSEHPVSRQAAAFDQQMRTAESQLVDTGEAEIWYGGEPTNSYRNAVAGADSQSRIETATDSELPVSRQPAAFDQESYIPESRLATNDEAKFLPSEDHVAEATENKTTGPTSESVHEDSLSESRFSRDRSSLIEEDLSQARQLAPNAQKLPVASRSDEVSSDDLRAAPLVVEGRQGLDATRQFSELVAGASKYAVPSGEPGGFRREECNEFGDTLRYPAKTFDGPAVVVLSEQTHPVQLSPIEEMWEPMSPGHSALTERRNESIDMTDEVSGYGGTDEAALEPQPIAADHLSRIHSLDATVSAGQRLNRAATTSLPIGVVERKLTRKIAVPPGESISRTADVPSPGTSIFTTVVVNLITVFAALVVGLFVLVLALFLILKGKAKGAGINLRVEFVGDQPLANFVVGSPTGVPLAYQAAPGGVTPVGTADPATESEPVSNRTRAGYTNPDPTADILPFEPPILSLDEQRREKEEEERNREKAILTQIVEENIELREQLAKTESSGA